MLAIKLMIFLITGFLTYVVKSDVSLCDICQCTDNLLNCTEKVSTGILNLTNYENALLNIEIMHFDFNKIVRVKSFPSSKVNYLSLQHNDISEIDDYAFENLLSLTNLDLSYNSLTSEILNSNSFKINHKDDANFHASLTHLKLDYNSLNSLQANTFKHLRRLQSLSLAGNPFRVIDRLTSSALSSLPSLKHLDLSSTMLKSLPEHFLDIPRLLMSLNLSKNDFKQVPPELAEAHKLNRLDLSYNPIKNISNFPKIPWLKILHLSHMPELLTIEERAFSLLSNLEEFHCSYNIKLFSIAPNAFQYEPNDDSEGVKWPQIVKLNLNNNALGYLDSNLLSRWDTLIELNLQGNKWICDCENQWLVSTLAPMIESKHPELLKDFTCQEPIEMRGISIIELDHRRYHMRCLDSYNNRPEKDGVLLVGILIGVMLSVPFTMSIMIYCAKNEKSLTHYQRMSNFKSSLHRDFHLRETPVYRSTSVNINGF
ncbi:leucine-rich repeat neuronal protein 2-like [Daktulosphaira vitifoliae]|uniref:leucine-rich repeat neuronal protein 2-like n=1 Tax=Daktulosphaira vitifoliae TaxID=58002 RepID=UPI0021A97ABA|nr:leucine-rich repeat neuronal protein 2-like [Daktulosphaira vitifoliae]